MTSTTKHLWVAILLLGGMRRASPALANSLPAPPPVASKFLALFDQLRAAESHKAKGVPEHVAFQFSDAEINEYMRYSLSAAPRPGLKSVTVKVFAHNYISTYTIVDFDAVERWKPGTIPALLRPVLNGQKLIWVDYRFQADQSLISFSVEKAYYQNVRLPAFLVEKMIQIVAARQPEKYDTSKPLPIPFGLRQVWTSDHIIQGQN
jgi:hypothetical protein